MSIDLLIQNGRVIDPAQNIDENLNIGIDGNKIVFCSKNIVEAGQVIDASDCMVFPGLIDFHTHVCVNGTSNGVQPDFLAASGTTSVVDAGSSGCLTFPAFYKSTIVNSKVRVKAYLSCCSVGLGGGAYHENFDPSLFDKKSILQLKEEYPDLILGLKIRVPRNIVSNISPLVQSIELAEAIGNMPVCVHVTNASFSMGELASLLRKGDIFCHVFHGTGSTILDSNGQVIPEVIQARNRGVIFDMSHGNTNFSNQVCSKALKQGFLPDVISTDIGRNRMYYGSRVHSLPYVMSGMIAHGMSLIDTVRCVTETPAKLMGMASKIGSLIPESYADVAVFKLLDKKFKFEDVVGDILMGNKLLVPMMTIISGQVAFSQVDFNLA